MKNKLLFRVMRLLVLFWLVGLVHVSAATYSQTVTLKGESLALADIFNDVRKQTGLGVYGFQSMFEGTHPVTVNVKAMPMDEFLKLVLTNQPLEATVENGVIVFKRKRKAEDPVTRSKVVEAVQQRTLTGRVTDEHGDPLEGVTVQLKGTTIVTRTDPSGLYNITLPPNENTLLFSIVGFEGTEVEIGDQSTISVSLSASISDLEEVVVVGYGTVKKGDLTGSVSRLNAESFENQQLTQVTDMLSGTVAGFNSNQATSAVGGGTMEIRGRTSLNANSNPLIVLDGVIYNGSIASISPADIETIDILKDASSAAVFGSRAAAGVILITTKKGSKGKSTIYFSADLGRSEVTSSNIRPLSGAEYTTFRRDWLRKLRPDQPDYYFDHPNDLPEDINLAQWVAYNDNPNADVTTEWLNRLLFFPTEITTYLNGNEENWYDRVIRKGLRQNYDLSINGGTENISYYWSIGYTNNEGLVVGDDFSTFRTRLNFNTKVTDYLDVGINAQFSADDNSGIPAVLSTMLSSSPYGAMYEEDGSVKWFPNDFISQGNPLINPLLQYKQDKTNAIFASIYADLKLPLGFSYRLSFQPRFVFNNDYNFWPSTTPTGFNVQGRGTREEYRVYEWMVDNLIGWEKEFDIHKLNFTFLYNIEKFNDWSSLQTAEGFSPNENLNYHALQYGERQLIVNDDNYSTGDALMARVNYGLLDRYLFTLSVRRDGYSAFGQGNPRALFPAAAFAWRLSDEAFYHFDFLDQLKIRFSWGVNGNREIGRYAALARLSQNLYSNGSQVLGGVVSNSLANPSLAWEKTKALNFGVDFGFKGGKINGSVDLYDMRTNDLLMERVLPRITGFDNITTNLGELQNRGVEVSINSHNLANPKFSWKSNFVFSLNRNKIVSLFGDYQEEEENGRIIRREVSDISNEWFIGEAVDRVWDYRITGVWQLPEEQEASRYGLTPGDYKAEDVNNDGNYTISDKQFIGWREPRFRIGFRNDFSIYSNLSVSIFIRGDLGHIGSINAFKHPNNGTYDRMGMRSVPYWTPENPSNKYGAITAASSAFAGGYDLYFDRSFVRIQDLSIAYRFSENVYQRKLHLQGLKLYFSVRNLYSFDKWEDWDPESGSSPMPRTYSVGLQMSL